LFVLLDAHLRHAARNERRLHLQSLVEQGAKRIRTIARARDMIENVAEQVGEVGVNPVGGPTALERLDDADERLNRALKPDDLTRQVVNAAREHFVLSLAKEFVFDLVDVILKPRDDGLVLIDDFIEHGIENRLGTLGQQLGVGLEAIAHVREVRRLRVAHRDDKLRPDEDVQLAKLDRLGLVDIARGA
jgi:hypothetical protein